MTTEQNRPPWNADPATIVAHCLKYPADYVEALLCEMGTMIPSPENHDWWDRRDPVQDAIPVAIRMGLPHDPRQHQQPHDVAHLIGYVLPTHSDRSDDNDEIFINRVLYPLFIQRKEELLDTLPRTDALEQIRWMVIEINHFYGSKNRVIRESRLQEAVRLIDWFRGTDVLHDRESGVVDVDTAAMREFREGTK